MASAAGVDLLRGRPTLAVSSTEAKLQQRKLDALKRGIHRIADATTLPYGVHMIGLGGFGTRIVEQVLRDAPDDLLAVDGSRLSALAIDIGEPEFDELARLASRFPPERSRIETLPLPMPRSSALLETLRRYRDFLTLESPLYRWGQDYRSWLAPDEALPKAGEELARAIAKAIYGQAYYDGSRPAAAALKRFARSIDAAPGDAVVCIVFALGDGVGSGIAVDLARHLSNGILGRRVLVTGIGIAPCEGDPPAHSGAALFPVLNELDCLGDENKNRGVVMSCGDLYRNPFTAGFIVIPQEPAWQSTKDLAATRGRVARELGSLLTLRRGANLWEMLRLLNWVAAPSTQHSAARTPWGPKWIHMLGFADLVGTPLGVGPNLPSQLGLLRSYRPEFIELRAPDATAQEATALARGLDDMFAPDIPPQVVAGTMEGSVQFILPRVAKTELSMFGKARQAYDSEPPERRRLDHALLLDQGIVLSDPSTRLEGMAGASLEGGTGWVAVPLAELRGESDFSLDPA